MVRAAVCGRVVIIFIRLGSSHIALWLPILLWTAEEGK